MESIPDVNIYCAVAGSTKMVWFGLGEKVACTKRGREGKDTYRTQRRRSMLVLQYDEWLVSVPVLCVHSNLELMMTLTLAGASV